jgi:peptidoglycan/xylan/chitin deacetylase (PgdA/CDA1 family)
MRLFRLCFFERLLYPGAIFRVKTTEKILYLTFDDGPDPDSTHQLLRLLIQYNIKAQFFCSGSASLKYPGLVSNIKDSGHVIGNHGFKHLDGWKTSQKEYYEDVSKAAQYTSGKLFRPPYGRLRFSQYRKLKKNYKIIFWDLMPYDFDKSFGAEKTLHILKKKIRPGSVIVLHDTSHSNANIILDDFITFSLNEGYRFELIQMSTQESPRL